MANPTDNLRGLTMVGVIGILLTITFGKGCQFDIACVGCIEITSEKAVLKPMVSDPPVLQPPVTNDQVRKGDNTLITCDKLEIPPPQSLRPLTKLNDDHVKTLAQMTLHISRQQVNLLKYGESVKKQVDEFNKYCK